MTFKITSALFITAFITFLNTNAFADDSSCTGPEALLSIVDRPSTADSACVVPNKKVIFEIGYQYIKLLTPGYQQNFPEPELRVGLEGKTELFVYLPNYIHQSVAPHAGFAANFIGIKHELDYSTALQIAIEAAYIPPSGSYAFGNKGMGGVASTIISYELTPQLNLTGQFSISTETTANQAGGQRFNSFNPDVVLTWSATEKLEIYGEVYGQSQTAPQTGSGFNTEGGVLYLLTPNVTVDLEAGQRISGALGNLQHYVGTGMAVMF